MSEPPEFTPHLYRALRTVARSDIGAIGPSGALRHHTDELSPRLVSALFLLRRDGYIQLRQPGRPSPDAWIAAELTVRGTQLLGAWMRTHQPIKPSAQPTSATTPHRQRPTRPLMTPDRRDS